MSGVFHKNCVSRQAISLTGSLPHYSWEMSSRFHKTIWPGSPSSHPSSPAPPQTYKSTSSWDSPSPTASSWAEWRHWQAAPSAGCSRGSPPGPASACHSRCRAGCPRSWRKSRPCRRLWTAGEREDKWAVFTKSFHF